MKKKLLCYFLSIILVLSFMGYPSGFAEESSSDKLNLSSKSAVLMEPTTGQILYEKNAHEKLRPASVTKIMTLLLIYDYVNSNNISWDEEVTVSEYAASMGGSQVYLEPNEIQTIGTMTKCIAIASANDAAVAMAEYIAGTEDEFAKLMNKKAKELGMNDTTFLNASGLDEDGHLTSAYDIALMSRELTTKYPEVLDITSVWMDTIVHKTRRGEEEFGLTNTNKLLKWYDGATGLKTGSTSKALYCLSGTAERNGLKLIGVVMAAPDYKTRFQEVMKMFDYGFANSKFYKDAIKGQSQGTIEVKRGTLQTIEGMPVDDFSCILDNKKVKEEDIVKDVILEEILEAPVKKGDKVGEIIYKAGDKELGKVDLVADVDVPKAKLKDYLDWVFKKFFG